LFPYLLDMSHINTLKMNSANLGQILGQILVESIEKSTHRANL